MTDVAMALADCPFCGLSMLRFDRPGRSNPYAKCGTEGCFGARGPVVNLDSRESNKIEAAAQYAVEIRKQYVNRKPFAALQQAPATDAAKG